MGKGMNVERCRWQLAEPQPDAERCLVTGLDVSSLLARLLANRGLTDPSAAAAFLEPRLADRLRSPLLFRDMSRAAERVIRAIADGEQIRSERDAAFFVDWIDKTLADLRAMDRWDDPAHKAEVLETFEMGRALYQAQVEEARRRP